MKRINLQLANTSHYDLYTKIYIQHRFSGGGTLRNLGIPYDVYAPTYS